VDGAVVAGCGGDEDGAAVGLRGDSVLDGVFDEGLEGHGRNFGLGEGGGDVDGGAEFFAKANALDVEVAFDEGEFLAEGNEGVGARVEGGAEEIGEAADDLFGAGGILGDEGAYGVEGVEEEVGVDPGFEGAEAGFGGKLAGALFG
jgi:hypothetical protein